MNIIKDFILTKEEFILYKIPDLSKVSLSYVSQIGNNPESKNSFLMDIFILCVNQTQESMLKGIDPKNIIAEKESFSFKARVLINTIDDKEFNKKDIKIQQEILFAEITPQLKEKFETTLKLAKIIK